MTPTIEALSEAVLKLTELVMSSMPPVLGRCVDICPHCGGMTYALQRRHERTVQWTVCPACFLAGKEVPE